MIGALFKFGNEIVEARISDNTALFRSSSQNVWATIDGMKISKPGVIKEFPELKNDKEWKNKAKEKFKKKIKSLKTEEEQLNYVIEDLRSFGYQPMFKQKKGFRPKKIL